MLWIPPGFGHGFAVLTEKAGFSYKVTDYYSPAGERTVLWNDPEIGIAWPISRMRTRLSRRKISKGNCSRMRRSFRDGQPARTDSRRAGAAGD